MVNVLSAVNFTSHILQNIAQQSVEINVIVFLIYIQTPLDARAIGSTHIYLTRETHERKMNKKYIEPAKKNERTFEIIIIKNTSF